MGYLSGQSGQWSQIQGDPYTPPNLAPSYRARKIQHPWLSGACADWENNAKQYNFDGG